MFGDLFGNFGEKQAEIKEKLATIFVESEVADGAIHITANANREITNIKLDKDKLDISDTEQLEDLMMVAINRAMELAAEKEAFETQQLMKEMLPPGLGDLTKMFGRG